MRSGEPLVVTDEALTKSEPHVDPEKLRLLRALGLRASMTVPMRSRGQLVGAITLVDARDRRRYGPAEMALAQDLAGRAAIAVENARLYRDAQAEVRLREEFLSVASHELRTPVTSLQLAVQGLLEIDAPPPEFLSRALRSAERQSRRLGRLVDSLLDVSRIQAGRLVLEREPVDLVQLCRDVAGALDKELARAGCPLTLDAPETLVGRWDRGRIEQVITNLVGNAIKYAAGAAIELVLVRVDGGDGPRARLSVQDHGMGIAPAEQARIFERFERAVPERHYGGLGLGLYIVRRILSAHGGSIRVESVPGGGATFIAELPLDSTP
jgi:signal transduction histidine kinase